MLERLARDHGEAVGKTRPITPKGYGNRVGDTGLEKKGFHPHGRVLAHLPGEDDGELYQATEQREGQEQEGQSFSFVAHSEHRKDLADSELYFGLSSFHSCDKDSFMDL